MNIVTKKHHCRKHGYREFIYLSKLRVYVCPDCVEVGMYHPMINKEYREVMSSNDKGASFYADITDAIN